MKKKLQIFISSTFTDLIEERQAAVSAILKAGHIPAGMELFTAGDESQMVTIKRWIDESDIYMLILGGRYGSVEPLTGKSYTELEYDYAINTDKPFFAVVIDDAALEEKVKIHGTGIIERDNPKELRLFKEKVLSKISSFFKHSSDIKLAVHETIGDFQQRYDFKGWVSGDTVASSEILKEINELRKNKDQLVAELESLKTEMSSSLYSNQEESQFQYLYEKLNRPFDIRVIFYENTLVDGIKNIPGKRVGTYVINIPLFGLLQLFSKVRMDYERRGMERFLFEYLPLRKRLDGYIENPEQNYNITTRDILNELFAYGLLEREVKLNSLKKNEYVYLISAKMHSLMMWADSKGLINTDLAIEITPLDNTDQIPEWN